MQAGEISPLMRVARRISFASLTIAVLACGYTFGRRVTGAEADAAPVAGSNEPGSSNSVRSTSPDRPDPLKASSDKAQAESPVPADKTTPGAAETTQPRDGAAPDAAPGNAAGNAGTASLAAANAGSGAGTASPGPGIGPGVVPEDLEEVVSRDGDLLAFDATAYCLPGYTAAGTIAHRGTIAADPRILPLGSVVHLRAGDYSGTYLVLDTGAKIKGRRIDIYMPTRREALSFGRRSVRIKVLGKVRPSHLQPK